MAKSFTLLLLITSFVAPQVLIANATALVPAIYVFGDSGVDAGNNNHLNTIAKANKWPSGVDLDNIHGRFTNGKNGADFSAIFLGLPMPPPYLNLSEFERSQIITGINYGSASCGILNTTGVGECLSLGKQIEYFTSTATVDLPKAIKSPEELKRHLAKSIYLLLIGLNDYNSHVNNGIMNGFTPEGFAQYLLDEMTKHIQKLYDLGGRKFLVSALTFCEAYQNTSGCEAIYYSEELPGRLQKLQSKLSGSLFTMYNGVNLMKQIQTTPEKFGIIHLNIPCHVASQLCANRSEYNQYDIWGHQTEVIHKITSIDCFNGTSCTPLNLLELAKAP